MICIKTSDDIVKKRQVIISKIVQARLEKELSQTQLANQEDWDNQTNDIQAARKCAADLVDAEGDRVSEAALVKDSERRPFGGVHLALDCAHSREARSAEQVEYEEGEACNSGEYLCKRRPSAEFSAAVQNTHCADDVLFGNKTCDRSDSRLPVAPAEGSKYPSDAVTDCR